MKMTPGPSAANILGSGGSGAFLNGDRVPQAWSSDMREGLLDAMNGAVGKGRQKSLQRPTKILGVFRFESDLYFIRRIIQDGIRAEKKLGKPGQDIVQHRGNDPFSIGDIDILGK
jgi:hypothetical protein